MDYYEEVTGSLSAYPRFPVPKGYRNAWDERDVKERLRREGWDPEREICDGCLEAEEEGA